MLSSQTASSEGFLGLTGTSAYQEGAGGGQYVILPTLRSEAEKERESERGSTALVFQRSAVAIYLLP